MHRIEINLASTTPKQDEEEDNLNRDKATSPDPKKKLQVYLISKLR